MKTAKDPRHQRRQEMVKAIFAESFTPQHNPDTQVKKILENLDSIDDKIRVIAPEFPIDKINKVDLAILRLGVYELSIDKSQPEKVVIDESIELAKEFGNDTSAAFINGALGKLVKTATDDKSTTI
ncbi:MAG TPA: transcription antitermination factor NusB [Patescibacteria group bacterium]|nr:transcription antitermination factor NusB [Patescibacteria group bacterium]